MAYTEKRMGVAQIEITDPATGLSVKGPPSTRAKMKERLAAKIAKGKPQKAPKKLGEVTEKNKGEGRGKSPSEFVASPLKDVSETEKLGAKQKQYPASTMPSPVGGRKEKKKELHAGQLAKRGKSAVKKKGPAKMTGYGPDSGKQSIKDIIKEGIQEAKLEEQPDDVATTGVEEPTNIAERYPSAIPEKPKPKLGGTRKSFHPTARKLQETALPPQLQKQTGPVFSKVSHPAVKHQLKKQAEQMMKEDTGSGGIRPEPGESLIEFNERLEGMNLTEDQIKGIISNSDFADQLVTDAQIDDLEGQVFDDKTMTYSDAEEGEDGFKRKSKPLDIGPESGLDQERVPKIQELFESKDPEAELIASQEEMKAAIRDAEERRELARKKAKDHRIVGPEPAPTTPTAPMAEGDLEEQESQALQQSDAQAQENENIAQKIKKISEENFDLEANQTEIKKLTKPLNKEDTAQVKEEAGNWYVDPWTGFAIDLNKLQKRQDRKDAMEMASLLPADKRAMYLYQQELIEQDDLDKLIAPSEKEKLARKLTETQIAVQASNLLLNNKKLKNYQSPEQKEWYTSYRNAVTNDDMDGIYTFGRKLNLSEHELKKIVEGHKKAGLAKATKKDTDIFKKRFNIPYTKVWDSRQRVMMESAKVFEEGQAGAAMNFMGQRYAGRKGLLEDNGLYEIEGARALGSDKLAAYFANLPDQKIFQLPRWQTPEGEPDYAKILNSPTAYQRLLQKNLIYRHMDTLTNGEYKSMEQYRAELQKRDESINQHLVSQ